MSKSEEINSECFIDHRETDRTRSTLKIFSLTVLNKYKDDNLDDC